jgi:hypothetical protein
MLLTDSRDTWSKCRVSFVVAIACSAARDESFLHNHERCYHPDVPWFKVGFEYCFELKMLHAFGFAAAVRHWDRLLCSNEF